MVITRQGDGGILAQKRTVGRTELQGELGCDLDITQSGNTLSTEHRLGPSLPPHDGKRDVTSGLHGLLGPNSDAGLDLSTFTHGHVVGDHCPFADRNMRLQGNLASEDSGFRYFLNQGGAIIGLNPRESARWKDASASVIDDVIKMLDKKGFDGKHLISVVKGLIKENMNR